MLPKIIDLTGESSAVPTDLDTVRVKDLLKKTITQAPPSRRLNILLAICDKSPEAARIAGSFLLVPEDDVKYLSAEASSEEEEEEEEEDEEDYEDYDEENDEENDEEADEHVSGKGPTVDGNSNSHESGKDPTVGGNSNSHDDGTDKSRKEPSERIPAKVLATKSLKRMRARYAKCENCAEEFDVTNNAKGDCVWHEGEIAENIIIRETSVSLGLADSEVGELERNDRYAWYFKHMDDEVDIDEELNLKYPKRFLYQCCDGAGDSEGCKTGRHVERDRESKRRCY